MPATTPEYSGLEPWSWARIMSWPGPRTPRRTPRISTAMGSGLVPLKTVQAVAVMPRLSSLSGKKPPVDGGGEADAWAAAAWVATWGKRKAGESATQDNTTSAARRTLVSFRRVPTSIRVQPGHEGENDGSRFSP